MPYLDNSPQTKAYLLVEVWSGHLKINIKLHFNVVQSTIVISYEFQPARTLDIRTTYALLA